MRFPAVAVLVVLIAAPEAEAMSQGYGIRSTPSRLPRTSRVDTTPGYEGDYDRDYRAWKEARRTCLRARTERVQRACPDFQSAPPSPSDYLKARPAD